MIKESQLITILGGSLLPSDAISFIPPVIDQFNKLSDDIRVVLSHLDETLPQHATEWIEAKTGRQLNLKLDHLSRNATLFGLINSHRTGKPKTIDIGKGLCFFEGNGTHQYAPESVATSSKSPIISLRDWDDLCWRMALS